MTETSATSGFDWDAFEHTLTELLCAALATIDTNPDARLYAIALHGVYRELDGTVTLPLLAANSVAAGAPADEQGFWGERWNPPDWAHPEIELPEQAAIALETSLMAEATRGDRDHWRQTWRRYHAALLTTTRALHVYARDHLRLSDDAVVFWFDPEGGHELARETIDARLFERLFAPQVAVEQERARVQSLAPSDRADYLVARFDKYDGITGEMAQRDLLDLGVVALPALVATLDHPTSGWTAAKVIGQIGHPTDAVIAALRSDVSATLWHAMALGMLGDFEWLRDQPPAISARGLTARLKAIGYNDAAQPPPLDYRSLEAWLDDAPPDAYALAEQELKPGQSYVHIDASDVDEALRGLRSPHAVVRWHAASSLGDRDLGSPDEDRIPWALSTALSDVHPLVRRLAVLALGRWKDQARPYRQAMAALLEDPDEVVVRVAKHALSNT